MQNVHTENTGMDGAGFHRAIRSRPFRRIQPGDRVRVVSGPLTDCLGTVLARANDCRLVIRLSDVGNDLRVIIPCEALELAQPV